ncbi:hypothetical protein BN8_00930 [Fibrisoma limi BUZ 3]|uniref:Uncharacterized protein n=1 Tax=Fibrisoma limi BUZ 3 TaxID=1185876 RepID=I2GDJ5_9BACT|nr:hypothetical protein [Fibrisoma limi]CCH51969.1 hypothetical protein BN8_00930 [Fibrisoma limi BUZ 3]
MGSRDLTVRLTEIQQTTDLAECPGSVRRFNATSDQAYRQGITPVRHSR